MSLFASNQTFMVYIYLYKTSTLKTSATGGHFRRSGALELRKQASFQVNKQHASKLE